MRDVKSELASRLQGALNALRELQECVPPKDWGRYATAVLDLERDSPINQLVRDDTAGVKEGRQIEDCPELNLLNYEAADVERLNDWAVRADAEIERLASGVKPSAETKENDRNALFALDGLVLAYVPRNTNDWREGLAALDTLRGTLGVAPVPTPQQISDYLNGLDAIQREVVEREARAAGGALPRADQPKDTK